MKSVTLQWSEQKNGVFPIDRVEELLDRSVLITDKAEWKFGNKVYYRQEIRVLYNREITEQDIFSLGMLIGSSLTQFS